MSALLPIAIDIEGRRCVIAGGGSVALRRARSLLECGATVCVVAPELASELSALATENRIEADRRSYSPESLDGAFLVVAATDDPSVNAALRQDARDRGILCCDATEPDAGDFVFAATVRRGDLMIGITTGGASPSLAVRLRNVLYEQFGPEWADYVALLREARDHVIESVQDPAERGRILYAVAADETVFDLIREGRADEARTRVFACTSSP